MCVGSEGRGGGYILTLQIKLLLDELRGRKSANGKAIQPNQTQLWPQDPGNKCEQCFNGTDHSLKVAESPNGLFEAN